MRAFGCEGSGDGQLKAPRDVHVRAPFVFVADRRNSRVQVFRTDGAFVHKIGRDDCMPGTAPGELGTPNGVAIGENGDLCRISPTTPSTSAVINRESGALRLSACSSVV